MPYVIALVIMIVAAGAILLFRQPADVPVEPIVDESPAMRVDEDGMPVGFVPPNEQPPMDQPGSAVPMMEAESEVESEASVETQTPRAVEVEASAETQTYVAQASYFTPRRTEHDMAITLELDGETVVGANVLYDQENAYTPAHTGFDQAYKAEVIGKNINDIDLSRVGGASLTSTAFNEGVADIIAQL